jgi:hypothetical protein
MNKKFAISPPKISLYVVKQGGEGGGRCPAHASVGGENGQKSRKSPPQTACTLRFCIKCYRQVSKAAVKLKKNSRFHRQSNKIHPKTQKYVAAGGF